MTADTPGEGGSAKKRRSMTGNFRKSSGGGAIPRAQGSMRTSRVTAFRTTSQPQYDIISGQEASNGQNAAGSLRASSHESFKENMAPPDAEHYETQRKQIEELKAELATERFKSSSSIQETEMKLLQHQSDVRDAQRKADEDFKQRQAAEGEFHRLERQLESLHNDLNESKENWSREKLAIERKARDAEDEARLLKEQLEELSAAKDESERISQKRITDLQAQVTNQRQSLEEIEKDAQARETLLQQTQEQLADKDKLVGDLEADVLRLKAQTGDADTIAVIKRELAEQVSHIRSLEAKTSKQHAELTHLRQIHKAVEVVEEEKRSLQRKLEVAQSLETELTEAKIQRQRLEDERLAWTSYLQNASETEGVMEFDSPEAVARALVQERYNSASLIEKIGEVQPQIAERDEIIKSLENEKGSLAAQLEKLKTTAAPVSADKARARIERQRALAAKEVEYLRAQLKTFDAEDETFEPEKVDHDRMERISQLEQLVDKYKSEVQELHAELSSTESSLSGKAPEPVVGNKRKSTEDIDSEQIGELNRKRRKLADDLSKAQAELQVLQKDNSVLRSRLQAAETQNKTRVLSLRSNPTSDWEAIKVRDITALKEENKHLLAKLQKNTISRSVPVIPASQLAAAKREVEEAEREKASAEKKVLRLKQVWAAKSNEFKEAIFSTLGWKVTFIPNGKMRVESVYCESQTEENENSIVFDGERGTMKVSGGPQSPFALRINDQIQFWVREKGCIPGFLAALTLEFCESEQTRVIGS
ncbi:spindle assembly checkpoint component Mad1 [Truncatella angustata]|uniref:Spindle assembly checkpoint component MAD1 n=1 Tax=Truncatella angustata TaxID=152316 RepID=A0A9P8UVE2_9PEZI|nr:spindle assembly checkpoint component Mad1 [Truncatella angustata]KAH6659216.1 spindle assembly checkpoint component Mad1 [Truncatella angustata]